MHARLAMLLLQTTTLTQTFSKPYLNNIMSYYTTKQSSEYHHSAEQGSEDTKLESEKLAYVWFGIDKEVITILKNSLSLYELIIKRAFNVRSLSNTPTTVSRRRERPCTTLR